MGLRKSTRRDGAAVGELRWDGEVWRRWSGHRWARAAYSLQPARLRDATPHDREPAIDRAARERALALAVEDQVSLNRGIVVLEGPSGVVLGYQRPVAHFFYAVVTLLTLGLGVLLWILAVLDRRQDRVRLEVDRWGNVWAVPLPSA